jgi:hypothetical protein
MSESATMRDVILVKGSPTADETARSVDILPRGRSVTAMRGGRLWWVGGVCPVSMESRKARI